MEKLVLSDASCDALSCVAPQGSVTTPVTSTPEAPSTVAPEVSPAVEKAPTIEVPELPCSEVVKIDGVTIRYGDENIYHGGAVLPHKEGLACLDVLTGWLKGVPQSRWQVTLAGEEGLALTRRHWPANARSCCSASLPVKGSNCRPRSGRRPPNRVHS
jgi:hypothetical protein